MRTILTLIFISLFVLCCSNAVYADETTAQTPDNFVTKLRSIADRMEVFPVDFIARKGPLCYQKYGYMAPDIEIRRELSRESFRTFYDFCFLAIHASEKDVESCINVMETESPKVQALILTTLYIHAYPWSDELLKQPRGLYLAKCFWSWFGINVVCFDVDITKRTPLEPQKRLRIKKIIAKYTENKAIAFNSVVYSESDYMLRFREDASQSLYYKYAKCGWAIVICDDITKRSEYCKNFKTCFPRDPHPWIADMLWDTYYTDSANHLFNRSSNYRDGNTSAEPKTVGQIATQLLESWDPPPPFPRDELLLRHYKIPDEFKKLLPNPEE